MKKILLGALVLVSLCVKAEILLWQINSSSLPDGWPSSAPADFFEARLMSDGESGVLQYAGVDLSVGSDPIMEVQSFDMDVLPNGGTAQSFYIELYSVDNGQKTLQAYTAPVRFEALSEFMNSSLMATNLKAWSGGTFNAAPEPTSGLLMLLGLAGLVLRRKR